MGAQLLLFIFFVSSRHVKPSDFHFFRIQLNFQIEGLNTATYHLLLTSLYDSFMGKTIRCGFTDTDDIIYQLTSQLNEMEKSSR